MLAWNGSLGVSKYEGVVSPAYCVYQFRDGVEPWFFHYLLKTAQFKDRIKAYSRGIVDSRLRLYSDDLYRLDTIVPPLDEQQAIVKYLGHAHARINGAVAKKRRLIGLLEEQRQAIISHAVTRGLDPSAEMKDSGNQAWGIIPASWVLLPVKRLVSLVTSGSRGWAEYYSDYGPLFIQSGNLGRDMRLALARLQRVLLPESTEGIRTRVAPDDVLVCITGALTGNVVVVDHEWTEEAYVNQHVALLRPLVDRIAPKFLGRALWAEPGQVQFHGSQYGGTKQGLGLDDVNSAVVAVPPLAEQQAIVDYIDSKVASINRAAQRAQREIDLLTEFRVRLTSDVVTGQVDVRQVAATLPDLTEAELSVPDDTMVEEPGLEDEDDS